MTFKDSNYLIVSKFLEKYPEIFSDLEKSFILDFAKFGDEGCDGLLPDLVREVYDELGVLPDNKNLYKGFIEMAEQVFNLKDRNILEIGGGVLPRLGIRISSSQDFGNVTVYDPRLSKYAEDSEKLKLVRKKFNREMNVDDIDLMLGLMPCKAAEVIVDVATKNKIDFMIALCEGGLHGEEFDYYEDDEEWRDSLIHSARRVVDGTEMGKLMVKYMTRYDNPYPVIYNDRSIC